MKKLIFVFLSLFIFSTITLPEPSLAATQQKKASVKSSKKKAVVKSSKNKANVKSPKKKTAVKPSNKKVVKVKQNSRTKVKFSRHAEKKYAKKNVLKVRYSHNINKPQEGDLLKLEGMVKDLNEQ
jgi:lipopolysaccharide export LptBFGC system permease protein LptF